MFEKIVSEHEITGAFLNSTTHHIPKPIINYLYNHENWHMVYFNYDAVIFLRDAEINKSLIKKFKIDLTHWQVPKIDRLRLGAFRVRPYQPFYRGYTLESLGLNKIALEELEDAVGVDPFYADAHDLIGKIYAQNKKHKDAFEHFRIAVTISPGSSEKRHNLALSYYDLGENKMAIEQYDKIIHLWPNAPKGYFLITKMYVADGQFSQALNAFKQAYRLSPEHIGDFLELSDMMFEEKAYDQAGKAYRLLLTAGGDISIIHKKLGYVSLAAGDRKQAKVEFQKALSLTPDDEEITNALQDLR